MADREVFGVDGGLVLLAGVVVITAALNMVLHRRLKAARMSAAQTEKERSATPARGSGGKRTR